MKHRLWFLVPAVLLTLLGMHYSSQVAAAANLSLAYDLHCAVIVAFSLSGAFWLQTCGFCMPVKPLADNKNNTLQWSVIALTAVCVGIYSFLIGMRQFAGFDHSALIDPAWRIYSGQRPYADFPCSLPVGFYLPAFYAFKLFGVSWLSLVLISSILAVISYIWICVLLINLFGSNARTWTLSLAIQACTTLLVGYWWYNPVTTVMGVVFFLCCVVWLRKPGSKIAFCSWTIALLIFAACKPNIAGPTLLGSFLVLIFDSRLRGKVLIGTAVAFGVFIGLLACNHIRLTDMLGGYFSVASRGFSFAQFLQDLDPREKTLSLITLGFIILPVLLSAAPPYLSRLRCLCLLNIITGLYGFVTNGESKLVDMPIIFIAAFVWLNEAEHYSLPNYKLRRFQPVFNGIYTTLAISLIFCGVGLGWSRHRVKLAGPGSFFEYQPLGYSSAVPFFAGLKSGPFFRYTLDEVSAACRLFPNSKIFFGPRMQWGYAAMNLPAPAHEPSWWHPGVSYKTEDEAVYLKNWVEARHEVLIFLNNDYTFFSQSFLQEIVARYEGKAFNCITIFTLKKTVPVP